MAEELQRIVGKSAKEIEKPVFTGKFKIGDKVKIKDIPGWKDQYSDHFRYANATGKIMDIKTDPGQDYQVYMVQVPKAAYAIVSFPEDMLEKI